MFGLTMLSPRVVMELILAAVIAGACWYGYNWVYDRGADAVQRKWDAVEKERAEESARIAAEALKVTKDLQESATKQRSAANAQIATLNKSLDAAINGLSNRPPRPDSGHVPGDSTAGNGGCTGRELFKPDAEFLTREAARAETLAIQLKQCKASYESARNALK